MLPLLPLLGGGTLSVLRWRRGGGSGRWPLRLRWQPGEQAAWAQFSDVASGLWHGTLPRWPREESDRRVLAAPAPLVAQADLKMVLAAGVPHDDAEGVAALGEAVGARGPEPLSDPWTLLRFYLARDRDVTAAAELFRATLDWRATFPIRGVMVEHGWGAEYGEDGCRASDIREWAGDTARARPVTKAAKLAQRFSFFARLPTTGAHGAPVLVWRAGPADFAGFVREGLVEILIQAFIVHLEDALQSARAASLRSRRLVRAHVVIDALGFSASNFLYIDVLRRVVVLCQKYYPEVTATITVVRAPTAVTTLFGLLQPWLAERTRRKISIVGEDFARSLRERSDLDVARLPAFLGGNASSEADDASLGVERVPYGVGSQLHGGGSSR